MGHQHDNWDASNQGPHHFIYHKMKESFFGDCIWPSSTASVYCNVVRLRLHWDKPRGIQKRDASFCEDTTRSDGSLVCNCEASDFIANASLA